MKMIVKLTKINVWILNDTYYKLIIITLKPMIAKFYCVLFI